MPFAQSYVGKARVIAATAGENPGLLATPALAQILGETLRIVGATSLSTLATGVNTGTAGAGTSATSLAKPSAAANWTASDLVGKWLKVVSGAGAPTDGALVLRPILSNTTTTLAVNSITGLDSTSVFEIVDLASLVDQISGSDLNGIRAAGIYGPVEIYGLDFSAAHALDSLIALADCTEVKVSGCRLAINTAAPSVDIRRCGKVTVEHCRLTSSADISITDGCRNVVVNGCVSAGGGVVEVIDFVKADIQKLSASSAPSRVLSLVRGITANVEAACSSGSATPVYFEDVANLSTSGNAITGTTNTGYGLEITNSGRYRLTGSTITGTLGDVLFMGSAENWVDLSGTDYGITTEHAAAAFANANYNKSHHYGSELHLGEQQFSARMLLYGLFNPSQVTGVVAAGSTSADAWVVPQQQFVRVDTVGVGTGIRLYSPAVAAVPGPEIFVVNKGANALKVYPPTGGTIDGAGADVAFSMAAGTKKRFVCVSDNRLAWESY